MERMPQPRKVIRWTYSVIALGVLAYLVAYALRYSDGGEGLLMFPLFGMFFFLIASWPASVFFLVLYRNRMDGLGKVLYPMVLGGTMAIAVAIRGFSQ